MNIIIIEDERLTAEDLADMITDAEPGVNIEALLSSVQEALSYFKNHDEPDLIFSDIQLGDGLSFEIFQTIDIKSPIIFCTAYDEYAIEAFKTNGIHYILKPFKEEEIVKALEKYNKLRSTFAPADSSLNSILQLFQQKNQPKATSVLVHYKEKIIPVKLDDIAVFYIKHEVTHLYTLDRKTYTLNKTLDEIQQITGNDFYRANRQIILNRNAIQNVEQYFGRKISVALTVPFETIITISKEKISHFLEWLEGGA
ncbi:LytTR family DNA-binding domain-containing protein [Dyadobacter sp. CY312]|uniref:LytR/AlgR family response regulator transcription factor n=1 Tax=Dyadobacter sp. CY312 TaxID=2907303 RepID=UPI001F16187F|nr:LytTR family DNA-binding domain-containing protein [Dyadobacter sp. CY312]MCE7042413.1 LytTR family DNA-binding domain-containing protein [Dyadobacter sp. CY312]